MTTKRKPLPEHLHAAWEWIDSAGEWGDAIANPETYARDAYANHQEHCDDDPGVTEDLLIEVIAWFSDRVTDHAEREGAEDYRGRSLDVARGLESAEWAWPPDGADEAYLNAVGTGRILEEIGLSNDRVGWEEICSLWCEAFRRGYERAHDAEDEPALRGPLKSLWTTGEE
jgi:hypothetical protein